MLRIVWVFLGVQRITKGSFQLSLLRNVSGLKLFCQVWGVVLRAAEVSASGCLSVCSHMATKKVFSL